MRYQFVGGGVTTFGDRAAIWRAVEGWSNKLPGDLLCDLLPDTVLCRIKNSAAAELPVLLVPIAKRGLVPAELPSPKSRLSVCPA